MALSNSPHQRTPEELSPEIEEIIKLYGVDTKFYRANCRFIIEETPKLFHDVPEIMRAYQAVQEIFDRFVETQKPNWTSPDETDPRYQRDDMERLMSFCLNSTLEEVWEPIYEAVTNYIKRQKASVAPELIPAMDIIGLRTLHRQFCKRDDLVKPALDKGYDGHTWYQDWQREALPTQMGERQLSLTLVSEPAHQHKTSFSLRELASDRGKISVCIELADDVNTDDFASGILTAAVERVLTLYATIKRQREIHSGEKYGDLDIVTTGAALMMGQPGKEFEDPMAAYLLSLDMFEMYVENMNLSALDYATVSVTDAQELERVMWNPSLLVYHTARGIMLLFKHAFLIGNDMPGILKQAGSAEQQSPGSNKHSPITEAISDSRGNLRLEV